MRSIRLREEGKHKDFAPPNIVQSSTSHSTSTNHDILLMIELLFFKYRNVINMAAIALSSAKSFDASADEKIKQAIQATTVYMNTSIGEFQSDFLFLA